MRRRIRLTVWMLLTALAATVGQAGETAKRPSNTADKPEVELWPVGKAPGQKTGKPRVNPKGLNGIYDPWMAVHLPPKDKANGTAVVICPGGGYSGLAYDHEGIEVAQWLNSHGVAGFVLRYRHSPHKHPIPLGDAQRAIRIVRSRGREWGVDPKRIGIMGFSAGGHLAASATTHFDAGKAGATDPIDRVSCRPDFSILIYAVISMKKGVTHGGSRNNLLGGNPDEKLVKLMSNELQVTAKTPPTFLVHATDDRAVPLANSKLFHEACKKAGVPSELRIYKQGGHGFGLGRKGHDSAEWPARCAEWLKARKLLDKKERSAPKPAAAPGKTPRKSKDAQKPAAKPQIIKTGTIDLDVVEAHYFVWKGRLLREQWCKNHYKGERGLPASHIAIYDVETGKLLASLAQDHAFGTVFVEDGTVYVMATYDKGPKRRSQVNLFASKDLKTWKQWNVIDDRQFKICNTSLIKVKDEYVLMFEIGKPRCTSWTARFAKSKDLRNWKILPEEYIHGRNKMAAPHCLKYHNGYFYNFHVVRHRGYSTFVSRSKDLKHWTDSPLNPVLTADQDDRKPAPGMEFTAEQKQRIATAKNLNNSDIDIFQHKGKCLISYSWGNQHGTEHLATAEYRGGIASFLEGWFPAKTE